MVSRRMAVGQRHKQKGKTMALDLTTLAPVEGSGMSPRRATRTSGPNPFLEEGWLLASYESGQDYEVGPLSGGWEDTVFKRGEREGQPTQRLTGDVATVVSMLRMAANKLGIGVSIEVVPAKRKGFSVVKYLGKERKNYTRQEDEESDE